ncbi:winged helix-turn-helix domain-containing protein [Angustibacter speluncae]
MGAQTGVAADVAALAALVADPTRAALCLALLDGRAWTAGELAGAAGIAPSTASAHLDRLVAGGLLVQERQGRHRYLRLAGPGQAALLETLLAHVGPPPPESGSLRRVRASAALARGRTCYDHLAGRLGVALTDAMVARGLLTHGVDLTPAGADWFDDLEAGEVARLQAGRRPAARSCLDWTERRPHLGGAAGAALLGLATGAGWVRRERGSRAVRLTPVGADAVVQRLGPLALE